MYMIQTTKTYIINWHKIMSDLNMPESQSGYPDDIVHELAHMYLAKKDLAFVRREDLEGPQTPANKFPHMYSQDYVNKTIRARYKTTYSLDKNEIESAAVSFLVLQPLGQADLLECLKSMRGNLSRDYWNKLGPNPETINKANNEFLIALENNRLIVAANRIREFLLKYKET
jgi:hypothetical protein